ncbi:MAG: hypothetical protein IT385_05280, partial [Deltaproteobacteria bacterium]|nr:hypothetical protein [Deltaproteobacteria bacterium]
DVAIYVDGRRQPLDPLYEHPPVPPDVPGAPLRVGAGLGTLDDLRVWKVRRPAMRVAGERLLLPPVSASSPDLSVAFDFDQHDGRAATRVSNRGPLGAALPGALEDGVTTAPDSGLAWSVLRLVSGDAAAESSGLDALAGLTLTTLFGPAHFRVELHAGADDLAASLYAREIPLVQVPHVGRTCLVDVALAADIPAQRASGQAKAAICRDAGPSIVGTVAVELGCPQGASCPTPPQRHVAKATGTVGPVVITPEGAPPLTLSGALTASTGSQEVRVSGALAGAGLTLTGDITLSSQGVHIATSLDPPPLFGVDLGPASCELDLDGQRLCGTCRTTTPACAVVLCVEVADGSISGAPPTCASVDIDKLPDGAPCVADVMCQSGHCGVTASVFSPFCYTPGSGGDAAACDPGLADQCLADLVCVASGCNPLLTSCVPWSCRPHVDLGVECVADAQCDPGQICKRPSWFLPRICVWPDRSRDVGESCYGPDECTTAACALGGCVCTADHDCPSGERCVLGACEPPPEAPRLPGQSCTSDSQCIVSYTNPNAGACVNGTCGCSGTADCQSSARYCGLPITDLPYEGTTPVGICLNKLPDGAPCAQGVMCGHDHCGGFLRPPVCYSPVTRRYGEACVAHDECVTGRCQLTCNWGGACAPPPPGTLITAPPPGCACTTTCGCASDVDCPGGWYCGAFTVDLGGVPGIRACLQKGATGSWCDGDNQCQSGDCFDVCINGHCQGACR